MAFSVVVELEAGFVLVLMRSASPAVAQCVVLLLLLSWRLDGLLTHQMRPVVSVCFVVKLVSPGLFLALCWQMFCWL